MNTPRDQAVSGRGERLLTATERLVSDPQELIGYVEALKATQRSKQPSECRRTLAERIIGSYSSRSALAGALTAAPAILPGLGSTAAVVAGSVVDMTLMLKHEVEMILCLTYLYGHDIRLERERWIAYVLAGVRTYEAQGGRPLLIDMLDIELDVLPKYSPRQLAKIAVMVLGKASLLSASRVMVKAVPFVGIAVSASANKLLTAGVGWSTVMALEHRSKVLKETGEPAVDAVVT
jgi:uncharacterized protein (DUF697 family)